jgi:GDP-L-fucose synthase
MGFWSGKSILVSGAAGFIGSHVVEELHARGARVTAADCNRAHAALRLEPLAGVRTLIGDLTEASFAEEAARDQEIVFHLAARMAGLQYNASHPAEMLVCNTLLDLQVLRACARNGVAQVLFCSGALVYDRDRPVPTPEEGPASGDTNPDCEGSAWAKRIGERAARYFEQETGMKLVVARLANVFGPRDDFDPQTAHLIGKVIRDLAEGKTPELHGDGAQLRAYLYVSDAVEALLRLMEAGVHGETVNVCARSEVTVRTVIDTITSAMASSSSPVSRAGPTGVSRRLLDTTKLRALTGFEERVSFREGIERTARWFLSNRSALEG